MFNENEEVKTAMDEQQGQGQEQQATPQQVADEPKAEVYDPDKPVDGNVEVTDEEDNSPVSIKDFLSANVESADVKEKVYFKRFKSPFIIKAITATENEEIRKDCTRIVINKNTGAKTSQVNQEKYQDALLSASVVVPNLNDEELQKDRGTIAKPADTLRAMLTLGEYAKLNKRINALSGVTNDDVNDTVEEVKK